MYLTDHRSAGSSVTRSHEIDSGKPSNRPELRPYSRCSASSSRRIPFTFWCPESGFTITNRDREIRLPSSAVHERCHARKGSDTEAGFLPDLTTTGLFGRLAWLYRVTGKYPVVPAIFGSVDQKGQSIAADDRYGAGIHGGVYPGVVGFQHHMARFTSCMSSI
jgi:hypothetical protein